NRASSNTADLSPVLTLLSNIFNSIEDVKKNPLIAYALLDGRNVSQGLAPYMNQALTDYVNQQDRLWGKN
ncbi:hypothetical protein, partial [Lactococcus lactis]